MLRVNNFWTLALFMVAIGCERKVSLSSSDQVSTWTIIRDDIFANNCVSCHVEGSSFARQSDLVLTADVAYEQLLNKVPQNQAAAEDGL